MFAIVDFETTGPRPGRDQVVEIAVVTVDEFGTVDVGPPIRMTLPIL